MRYLALVCALASTLLGSAAHAEPAAQLPDPIPAGTTAEARGPIRWLYPTRAASETDLLMGEAPQHWQRITQALGRPEMPAELDIRVALNPRMMQRLAPKGVGLPGYASGVALPGQGLILLTLTEPGTWRRPDMPGVLAHELSHVALHRAVDGHPVPRWFTEGVAIHFAQERSLERIRTLWEGALGRRLLPLSELSRAFPAEHHRVTLAYAQASDVVRFMLESGDDKFRALLAELRAGADFPDAVEAAYDRPLAALEHAWHQSLTARFATWPLVLSSLTGLWALGALLLVVGYVRARRRHHATLKRWEIEEAPLADAEEALQAAPANKSAPTPADDVLDAIERRIKSDQSVPTIEHEGRNYTLH